MADFGETPSDYLNDSTGRTSYPNSRLGSSQVPPSLSPNGKVTARPAISSGLNVQTTRSSRIGKTEKPGNGKSTSGLQKRRSQNWLSRLFGASKPTPATASSLKQRSLSVTPPEPSPPPTVIGRQPPELLDRRYPSKLETRHRSSSQMPPQSAASSSRLPLSPRSVQRSGMSASTGASPSRLPNGGTPTGNVADSRERRRKRRSNFKPGGSSIKTGAAKTGAASDPMRPRSLRTSGLKPSSAAGRPASRQRSLSTLALIYSMRLIILGVGVGAIAGTLLSVWDPASRFTAGASQVNSQPTAKADGAKSPQPGANPTAGMQLGQEMATVKAQVQALAAQSPQLMPGVFVFDSDSTAYLDVNGTLTFPAASTIKIPILVAFFQDVDAGKIRLDEPLTLKPEVIGGGSGELQSRPLGSQYSALEVATKMITISDNTATNMLIARLGGSAALNQRFQSWGLSATVINNLLPDLGGTNTTSPKDLVALMAMLSQGDLVSLRSRDLLLDMMRRTVNNSLLPSGIDTEATIAHKTGTIDMLLGDAGVVDTPTGKRYLVAILVKRTQDDPQAQDFIQQVSRLVYQFMTQPVASRQATPSPEGSSEPGASPSPDASPNNNADDAANPASDPDQTAPNPASGQQQLAQP